LLTGSISTKQNLSVKVAACVSLMALGAISCGKRSDTVGEPTSKF
jgi:hypothetical protein